jgi:UDP-glucose:glycoprotein glucosyltransferase
LDRARRQVPEWNVYDEEIAALARRVKGEERKEVVDVQEEEQRREKEEKDAEIEHSEL